jgi:hypothetical protein
LTRPFTNNKSQLLVLMLPVASRVTKPASAPFYASTALFREKLTLARGLRKLSYGRRHCFPTVGLWKVPLSGPAVRCREHTADLLSARDFAQKCDTWLNPRDAYAADFERTGPLPTSTTRNPTWLQNVHRELAFYGWPNRYQRSISMVDGFLNGHKR